MIGLRSVRNSQQQVTPATRRRGAGDVGIKRQGMRNAGNRTEKLYRAGEPDTEKLVRPVRWEGHRNLTWQQEKALGPYPTPPPFGPGKDGCSLPSCLTCFHAG